MKRTTALIILMTLSLLITTGCENALDPISGAETTENPGELFQAAKWPAGNISTPTTLVTVDLGEQEASFWPYIGTDFSSSGHDPISLVFFGQADPRDIRAALLALDGDRTAFGLPGVSPFNATWYDAIGDVLTAYGEESGWRGSSIQLECGDHSTVRFHLRLFRMGDWTVGGVHIEVMIPGTSTHQVLSWEMAEEFVKLDLMRTGLLDPINPISTTGSINPSPFRTIPAIIYNGLPVELRGMIGGPIDNVSEDVPIATDGQATVFNLVTTAPRVAEQHVQSFVIEFDQVIPKPFCSSGPYDYLYVSGPVQLTQTSTLDAEGKYETNFTATGTLSLIPIDPLTGQPNGEPLTAEILEIHESVMSDKIDRAYSNRHQLLLPSSADGAGQYFERIRVSSSGQNGFQFLVRCGDDPESLARRLSEPGSSGTEETAAKIVRF